MHDAESLAFAFLIIKGFEMTYEYAAILIPVAFIEIFVVLFLIWFVHKRKGTASKQSLLRSDEPIDDNNHDNIIMTFKHTYSSIGEGKNWTILLCLFRFCAFTFFLGITCIWGYVESNGLSYYYFTVWNIKLISLYYLLALIASIIGLVSTHNKEDSKVLQILTTSIHYLFQVCASTALFVTIINFAVLNPIFTFWNTSDHFITCISLIIEMSLNSMTFKRHHVALTILWAFLYIIFIWPLVMTGVINKWPYDFLKLNTPYCFMWYTGLFVIDIFFYFTCYAFSIAKVKYLRPDLITNTTKSSNANNYKEKDSSKDLILSSASLITTI